MDIKALLPKSHFVLNLGAAPRRELLRSLAAPLAADGIVTDLETFLNDVEYREDQITTQIAKDLAIPHARSTAVRRLGITIGITDETGVGYTHGAAKCRLFFLICIPAVAPTAHLTLLQGLVHFADDKKRMDKLKAATTPSQAINCLASYKWPA